MRELYVLFVLTSALTAMYALLAVLVYKSGVKKKKETIGGKRPLSGRKPAPYQTKTIAFRVRIEWIELIKSTVKAKVSELSQNSS